MPVVVFVAQVVVFATAAVVFTASVVVFAAPVGAAAADGERLPRHDLLAGRAQAP